MTEVWRSSWNSGAGSRVGAQIRDLFLLLFKLFAEPLILLASVVQSRVLGDQARRASVRPLATASSSSRH